MNKVLIITGLSFAGKTTLGNAIAARFGYEQVDVDVTKVDFTAPMLRIQSYHARTGIEFAAETDHAIVHHLQAGKTVVDASRNFAKRGEAAHKGACRPSRHRGGDDLRGYARSDCPSTAA